MNTEQAVNMPPLTTMSALQVPAVGSYHMTARDCIPCCGLSSALAIARIDGINQQMAAHLYTLSQTNISTNTDYVIQGEIVGEYSQGLSSLALSSHPCVIQPAYWFPLYPSIRSEGITTAL